MRRIVIALLLAPYVAADGQCSATIQKLINEAKYDEARAEADAVLKNRPSDDAAVHCMGRVFEARGESGKAVEWFEKAVRINDKSALHHLRLGIALADESQKANVLRQPFLGRRVKTELERAVSLDPVLIDARIKLAQFYAIAPGVVGGDRNKAREQIGEVTKLNAMRGHLQAAWLAHREKDVASEERAYLAASQVFPDSIMGLVELGNFYRGQKKWDQATAAFEQALKVRPEAIGAHLSLGAISAQSGQQLDRGEHEIKEWLSAAPKDAPMQNFYLAHYWLGMIYAAQGKKDAAKTEYEAALMTNPKGEDAKKALAALK